MEENTPNSIAFDSTNIYCNSLTTYSRFKTREVQIGGLYMGADHPIRIQSMTTTDTMDTEGTIAQSIRIIEAGSDLVRITAPSLKDAENLEAIKKGVRDRGYETPLIADIHFTPNAAEMAARIVEKVRVNPGNYADKKKFAIRDYTDIEYNTELDRIRSKFLPLVKICKEYGTAMRIGTNHGSLSDRILNRYGDTPMGMVESALEFVRICEELNYYNITLSMKASNPQVMVQAYRLLVNKMIETDRNYPMHLGVTEAGEGEDGRIKSAIGIGALLEDGIGDTIRVSLTEEPEFEIPVAQSLLKHFTERKNHKSIPEIDKSPLQPFDYSRRNTKKVMNIGGGNVPVVVTDFCQKEKITAASFFDLGYNYSVNLDKWNIADMACDYVFVGDHEIDFEVPGTLGIISNYKNWLKHRKGYPFLTAIEYLGNTEKSNKLNIVYACLSDLTDDFIAKLKSDNTSVLLIDTYNKHGMAEQRKLFVELIENNVQTPVIIGRAYGNIPEEDLQIQSASDMGALLLDGLGDGVFIAAEQCDNDSFINSTAFGILQATRTRISKTEYISCPSCGRTLFDLQETTAKIRSRTNHLKGVKIGIMGCIVNGPGEMADADYGYVGTGPGKITLYKGQDVVQRNVPSEGAVDALIALIRHHGDWIEEVEVR